MGEGEKDETYPGMLCRSSVKQKRKMKRKRTFSWCDFFFFCFNQNVSRTKINTICKLTMRMQKKEYGWFLSVLQKQLQKMGSTCSRKDWSKIQAGGSGWGCWACGSRTRELDLNNLQLRLFNGCEPLMGVLG